MTLNMLEEPMADQDADALIASYLNDVKQAIAPLKSKQRRQVIDKISAQISDARLEVEHESGVPVREMLDRLGTPTSIASAATAEGSLARQQTEHRREGSVMRWLLFGGLLFGIGWLVGLKRLWRSPNWSRSEKLLGTLVLPGGLLWAFTLEPRQVAAPGGVSLAWSFRGAIALLLPLASAAVLVFRRRRIHVRLLDA
jgi:hypothetical protein